jgi:hypothetical protein
MIRDEERERLTKYAEAMGVRVLFSQRRSDDGVAEWQLDGKLIVIYTKEHESKLDMILSLIHEVSHHCEHVRNGNREFDVKLDEAINSEEEKKKHRKKIYEWEEKSAVHWEGVYRDTDCKFPIYRLYIAREFDVWMYRVYYETGDFPSRKDRNRKRKELKEKYKNE